LSNLRLNINDETISALATASGTGAISVIRISGKDTFKIVDKLFKGAKPISEVQSHTIHYGKIVNNNEIIDDVLVSVFRNPNSYTGEDSVEISTHGSQYIVQQILKLLLENGTRSAEPGEFTKRAFLNGKMDLSQAEAVADVISARTEASARGARNQLDGLLSSKIEILKSGLINAASLIELELDFAEEDLEFLPEEKILATIDKTYTEIEALLATYNFGKIIRDGVNVAIVGQTNVGKSSLLNYLLKESRAIVSNIPGTTRDVIREEISIDGVLFKFYDTAGIRNTSDSVENEGVKRSRKVLSESDIVVFVTDSEEYDEKLLNEIIDVVSKERVILLRNKIDLIEKLEPNKFDVSISAKTGEGIAEFLRLLKLKVFRTNNYTEKTTIISNIRHFNALKNTLEHLDNARESIENKMTGEFISVDLRNAISSLGEIIGEVTSEDILNNIFSNFCIGK